MGQMFNYSRISCVISVNGVRFWVMRANGAQFEMRPGVLNVSWHTKYSWQHVGQTFFRKLHKGNSFMEHLNAIIVIIHQIRKLSSIEIFLGVCCIFFYSKLHCWFQSGMDFMGLFFLSRRRKWKIKGGGWNSIIMSSIESLLASPDKYFYHCRRRPAELRNNWTYSTWC